MMEENKRKLNRIKNNRNYRYLEIDNKDIIIFDSHNMALPIWGAYSNMMQTEFNLVTFDSHTDTRPPFAAEILKHTEDTFISWGHPIIKQILEDRCYKRDKFCFDDVFEIAQCYIMNDEHIHAAYNFDYIKSYTIICDLDQFEANSYERDDKVQGYAATYYVRSQQFDINYNEFESPLILDFDMDYFIQECCLNDKFKAVITPLVKKASLITIAREQECFNTCKIQKEYTNEKAIRDLLSMIDQIL